MRSKRTAYVLWFFLGWLGIHRFYCRKWVSGIIWLLTLGLFGAGWGADVILTSKMVEEANGLPKPEVTSKFRMKLRDYGLIFTAFVGFMAFIGVASWIEEKLDKRTPKQKTYDALEAKHTEYRQLRREYPSMELDGEVVPIEIQWTSSELIITTPKTYGFGATRFRRQSEAVPKDDFKRRSEEFENNYFLWLHMAIWSGPSPSSRQYDISIPKSVIPPDFLIKTESQALTPPTGGVKTHQDPASGYTVDYPSSWQPPPEEWLPAIKEQMTDRKMLFVAVSPDRKLNLQIAVMNEPPQAGESLPQILEGLLKDAPLSSDNATTNIVDVAGVKTIRHVADTTTPAGLPARYVHMLFLHNGRVWVIGIGGSRSKFQENRAAIDDILSSMRFSSHD